MGPKDAFIKKDLIEISLENAFLKFMCVCVGGVCSENVFIMLHNLTFILHISLVTKGLMTLKPQVGWGTPASAGP